MKLPTRRELPDYYDVIKKPLDIKKILARVEDGRVSGCPNLNYVFLMAVVFCRYQTLMSLNGISCSYARTPRITTRRLR